MSPIQFDLYTEYLRREAFKCFGDFKIGRQVIRTEKCVEDLVLLPKEEAVLQGVIERLIETARYYGMTKNTENSKVMRIARYFFLIKPTDTLISQIYFCQETLHVSGSSSAHHQFSTVHSALVYVMQV